MNTPIRIELPTSFEIMSVNCWLVKEPEPVLIDCGEKTEASWEVLQAKLRANGLQIKDLAKVFVTHAHMDHMGMANRIAQESGAEIWLPEYAREWAIDLKAKLDQRDTAFHAAYLELFPSSTGPKKRQRGYEMLAPFWDEVPVECIRTFAMDGQLHFAGLDWEVIYTPGHCINQTCFYHEPSGQLFSADMLLSRIAIPLVDAEIQPPHQRGKSLVMMMASYDKLSKKKINVAYPGHLEAFENVSAVIERQVNSIRSKMTKALDSIRGGLNNFHDIQEQLYGSRRHVGTFLMTLGILDLLMEEGQIAGRVIEGRKFYFTD